MIGMKGFLISAEDYEAILQTAREAGMDAGFGRGTKGIDVASFLVKFRRGQA